MNKSNESATTTSIVVMLLILFAFFKTCQNWMCTVTQQCKKAIESFKSFFFLLHSEILSVKSCDICVIEIPYSCVCIDNSLNPRNELSFKQKLLTEED